jgi:hypothetical protein
MLCGMMWCLLASLFWETTSEIRPINKTVPITVAAQSKAWTVFARSDAGIVGSNPTEGMDVCIGCVYSVYVLVCV